MTSNKEPTFEALKSDAARQRWEWFHRAITLAKKSNMEAMEAAPETRSDESEASSGDGRSEPRLSIAR